MRQKLADYIADVAATDSPKTVSDYTRELDAREQFAERQGIDEESLLDVFFFSSRRRHTRWTGDWSSDVCSSDLWPCRGGLLQRPADGYGARSGPRDGAHGAASRLRCSSRTGVGTGGTRHFTRTRSEERRVGNEG